MRTLPDGMVEALSGSTGGEARLQFNIWYDGALAQSDLNVSNWGLDWDISRQVQCQTKANVLDDDGTLTPWDLDDPLGAGGGVLQTKLIVGDTSASIGWQPITSSEPDEIWRTVNGQTLWVPGGANIPIEADDATEGVIAYRFMAPQQPQAGNTILQEIRLLLSGLMDVTVDAAVTDGSVPSSIVYKEMRMDAVEDLVSALKAAWRVTGDGQFHIYDPTVTTPVATLRGGAEGEVIKIKRKLRRATIYNGFVSRNTAADGSELQGIAKEETGPARWGGPLGYRTYFRAASFAKTQSAINADAMTTRDNHRKTATMVLPIRTVLNPAIELGDYITVMMPLRDGTEAPIDGRVLTINWSGGNLLPVGMDLTIECNAQQVRTLSKQVRDAQWQAS